MKSAKIQKTFQKLVADERMRNALNFLESDQTEKLRELREMTLISGAPHTETKIRSPMFKQKLEHCGLKDCFIDQAGNAFGFIHGDNPECILTEAHLDTVFGQDVNLAIKTDGKGILHCPGVADNTASMATLLSVLRSIRHACLKPVKTLMCGGTVGEEAPGEARGARYIMENYPNMSAYICLDSGHNFDVITGAVSCVRHEITFKGPGGHSWNNWGLPSAINAMGRAISLISEIKPETDPKTTFNIGLAKGGVSVNSIAANAVMHIDIRSLADANKNNLEARIMECARRAVEEENFGKPDNMGITMQDRVYGDKPGGQIPDDAPIVQAALESARIVGINRSISAPASTNANFPISAGMPSLCVNSNGACGNLHSLEEWLDPKDNWKGAQALLLLMFALSGLSGVTDPV